LNAEYNHDMQVLFLRMMITMPELYTRVMNIVNPLNFNRTLRPAVEFIVHHAQEYSILPEPVQIKAVCDIDLETIPEMNNEGHVEFFLAEFEKFTKRQELERAILKAADLLEKGEFDPVEKLVKDAVQISLMRDLGTDYFATPKERLDRYFNQGGQVSTGWPQLDKIMYGGFSRGELNIFAGPSGSGKSLVMMNIAINLLKQGLNGVYLTLELSEELTSLRTDAMITEMGTKEIRKSLDDTDLKVRIAAKKMGKYRVKSLPAQSNINAIRSFIKEVQIQTDLRVDFVVVDYLDLLTPASVKVNSSDQFIKDKYVSEELRNLAKEMGIIMITASQINRSGVEELEYNHTHIAGGISKINSADYVFGIYISRAMRERGKYQIQCMKSRSSTGVGNKIELDYNLETMRITDSNPEHDSSRETASSIMNKIRTQPGTLNQNETVDQETGEILEDVPKVRATVEGTKLKNLLSSLKQTR
jgi:replicative DNA helicase